MRKFLSFIITVFLPYLVCSQSSSPLNDLPSFIPPSPEASAIIKADNLSVGFTTGAANISIPLFTLQAGSYNLPVSLGYSTTGIKVDEIASSVGMGWSLNCGGMVSRTIMDRPDELRDTNNCNLTPFNFSSPTYELIQYLINTGADKQSDIYTFSFAGYSGKFILGKNLQPIQLAKSNIKIEIINGAFLEGFIITVDDGTAYYFEEVETSMSRSSTGTACKNDELNLEEVKTSWVLTKIVLPSKQKELYFTYDTVTISYASSISQTISTTVYSENYACSQETGPTGPACAVNEVKYSSCTSNQSVASRLIKKVQSSDGDKIEFTYDPTSRYDLAGGKRLASVQVTNRHNQRIKNVVLNSSYRSTINANSTNESYRLFLDSLFIRDTSNSSVSQLTYGFYYNNYDGLPRRLSFSQDIYGYFNGKTDNASLLPILAASDVNYSTYNNGIGIGIYSFGDRSIDTVYSLKGTLCKIVYPTGGYDTIQYIANRKLNALNNPDTEDLCGGLSVSKVKSYSVPGQLALEKEYVYRYAADNSLSTFLITDNIIYSFINSVRKDGYSCIAPGGSVYSSCAGPECRIATVTSNISNPITTYGSQHVYHRVVQQKTRNGNTDNGIIEHFYDYLLAGSLAPNNRWGNGVLNAPYHIVPELFIGEVETRVFANTGSSPLYRLVKKTKNVFENEGLNHYTSYAVKQDYNSACGAGEGHPPHSSEVEQFDVDEIYIYTNNSRVTNTTDSLFTSGGNVIVTNSTYDYGNSAYTYPTRVTSTASDGATLKIEKKYPKDYSGLSFMISRNILNPVIEEKQFRDTALLTTKTQTYSDWLSNGDLILPSVIEVKIKYSPTTRKILFHKYDQLGNVIEMSKEDDIKHSYIWDYKSTHPIAEVINADSASIAYTSFEADGKGNWVFTGATSVHPSAATGLRGYSLSNGSIAKSGLNTGTIYTVTFWKRDSTGTVAFSSGSGAAVTTRGGWVLYQYEVTGITSLTISGSAYIDELRLYSKGAIMKTYTYIPLLGIASECDANNRISYYEYDDFGRLRRIKDQDRNIVSLIDYQYRQMQNQ